jgi:hypothetical protein
MQQDESAKPVDSASSAWIRTKSGSGANFIKCMFLSGEWFSRLQAAKGSVATLQVPRDRLAGCSSWHLRFVVYSSGDNFALPERRHAYGQHLPSAPGVLYNIFFRLEMGKETALGHANMIGQYTDGYAGKAGSAQKVQACV